jgi:UDPglucose 6-dehydrogenase
MNISVIGTGYVGLTTGICFSELGNTVICMDTDKEKIDLLSNGVATFYEPELQELLLKNQNGRLRFTSDLKEAVDFAEVIFIAVGTPTDKWSKPDIKNLMEVVKGISNLMLENKIIVIKSTVPVGTCKMISNKVTKVLKDRNSQLDFKIVSNPEFLRQGSAINDFMKPDRIVIGIENKLLENIDEGYRDHALELMKELYCSHINDNKPYIITNLETAEMIKYASNAFLATKISYINEIAVISELYEVDVKVVAAAMGLDARIGSEFLKPGPGYGGSCFPKDAIALMYIGRKVGYEPKIVKATIGVNDKQIEFITRKIRRLLNKVKGRTITILGVAFKPNTDDLREAPAISIIKNLIQNKAIVKIYDPIAMENCKKMLENVVYCDNVIEACRDSECIVVLTEWDEFMELDFEEIREVVKNPLLIDTRNIYEPEEIKNAGFVYEGVGIK